MTPANPSASGQEPRKPSNVFSALQFGLSALAVLAAWGGAAVLVFVLLVQWFDPVAAPMVQIGIGIYLANSLLIGFLLLPSAVFSFARVLGRPLELGKTWQAVRPLAHPKKLVFLFPFLVLAGYLINRFKIILWLLLPPVNLLALSIPVVWFVWLAVRRLLDGSPQRTWGVFSSGLVLGPAIIIVLEILALLVFTVIFLVAQPDLASSLADLAIQYQTGELVSEPNPALLAEFTSNPAVLLASLIFLAVLIPLIEEAIKPVGAWLLVGRNLSPRAGFAAGVLSGAGFALLENLQQAVSGEEWIVLIVGRLGTTVLHIFNSGLIGYTLALAWKERRYLRLVGAYLLAVVIHGLWNALTLISVFAGLGDGSLLPASFAPASGVALVALAVGIFVMLVRMNRKLSAPELAAVSTD